MDEAKIKSAVAHFEALVREQYERSDRIKADKDFIDYDKLDKIIIGVCGGDGIGPIITKESARVLEYMLADDVKAGKVEFRVIDGLTIENRVAANKAIPDDVLEELKKCHVILKGPTTTPQAGRIAARLDGRRQPREILYLCMHVVRRQQHERPFVGCAGRGERRNGDQPHPQYSFHNTGFSLSKL